VAAEADAEAKSSSCLSPPLPGKRRVCPTDDRPARDVAAKRSEEVPSYPMPLPALPVRSLRISLSRGDEVVEEAGQTTIEDEKETANPSASCHDGDGACS
jgi:hypothetical protein